MIEWIVSIVAIVLAMVLIPWALSGLTARQKGGGSGGVGNALQEIDAMLNPAGRHGIEARQQPVKTLPGKADPPDDEVEGPHDGGGPPEDSPKSR